MTHPSSQSTLPYERFDTTSEKPERRLEASGAVLVGTPSLPGLLSMVLSPSMAVAPVPVCAALISARLVIVALAVAVALRRAVKVRRTD